MLFELDVNIVHLYFANLPSADRTSLVLRHLIFNFASEFIFFFDSLHEPIPIHADEVKPVEALIDSNKVCSISKLLRSKLILIFTELLETDGASARHRIIILSENLPNLLVKLIDETIVIFIFFSLIRQFLEPKGITLSKSLLLVELVHNFINLLIIEAFDRRKLKAWGF